MIPDLILWIAIGAAIGGIEAAAFIALCALLAISARLRIRPEEAAYIGYIIYFFAAKPLHTLLWAAQKEDRRR